MPATDKAAKHARRTSQRAWEVAARIAAVMLALYLIVPLLATDEAFAGFDTSASGIIVGILVVAAFGALALIVRRNRRLEAEVARLEERIWSLSSRAVQALPRVDCRNSRTSSVSSRSM